MKNNYCKLFVDDIASERLINKAIIKAQSFSSKLKSENIYIDVSKEYDINKGKNPLKGFLDYKYIIDIDFNEELSYEECAESLNYILKELIGKKIPAVASCDYEELLINKGRI